MAAKKHFLYPLFPGNMPCRTLIPLTPDESSRRSCRHSCSHLYGKGAKTCVREREGHQGCTIIFETTGSHRPLGTYYIWKKDLFPAQTVSKVYCDCQARGSSDISTKMLKAGLGGEQTPVHGDEGRAQSMPLEYSTMLRTGLCVLSVFK